MGRNGARWLFGAALAAGVGTAACGSEGGSTSLGDYEQRYLEAICSVAVRCGSMPDTPPEWVAQFQGSVERCVEVMRRSWDQIDMTSAENAVARGTQTYDAELAGECLGYLAAMPCEPDPWGEGSDPWAGNPECDSVIRPAVSPGGACYDGHDCRDGWCDFAASCPGTCRAYLPPGGGCSAGAGQCGPGHFCDYASGTCIEEPAEVPAGPGESCAAIWCADGLYCDDTEICREPSAEGGTCSDDEWAPIPCADGLYCAAGTCRPRLPAGGACGYPAWYDIRSGCRDGLVCSLDGLCVVPTVTEQVGAACSIGSPFCDILADLYCTGDSMTTMRCAALPVAGEPCERTTMMCARGTWCNVGETCEPPQPDGRPCRRDVNCTSGNCADDGTCRPSDPFACDSPM